MMVFLSGMSSNSVKEVNIYKTHDLIKIKNEVNYRNTSQCILSEQ